MRLLTPFFLVLAVSIGQAQDEHSRKMRDCGMCPGGEIEHHHRPYEMKFLKELPYVGLGMVLTGISFYTEYNNAVQPYTEAQLLNLDKNNINSFDRGATSNWSPTAHKASNILISTATFLPIMFVANHHTRADLIPLTVMTVEVLLINFGATILTKNLVNRARPLTYNANVPLKERINATSRESFFSGHSSHTTAASIFMAKVVTDYHPNMKKEIKIGIWTTMITLPAVTAYLRVKAGKHFPTDVIVGYLVGGAIGYLVPQIHKTQAKKSEPKVSMFPVLGPDHVALSLRLKM